MTTRKKTAAAPKNPAPADQMDGASGAIIEPAIKQGVEMGHPAVDSNPRAGTSSAQNAVDWNDPQKRKPSDKDFVGQGIDTSVYGKAAR